MPSRPAKVATSPAPPGRRKRRSDSPTELKRAIHELEVYQEEIRIQNQQLIESQRLLEDSRDRYADLYDFAPVAYVTLCVNGVIREINRTGAGLLGVTRGGALGSPFILFVDPAHRRAFLGHVHRCRAGNAPVATELTLVSRAGARIDAQISSGAGVELGPGEWRFPTTVFDLTERKRAEEERRRLQAISSSERLLRAVLSVLPVGVRVFDTAGNVQLLNDASRQIFGDHADLPLSRWEEYGITSHPAGEPLSFDQFPVGRALRHGHTILGETVQISAAPGIPAKILQLSALPLRDDEGQVVGAVGVSEDVTELKHAEARLRDAKEAAETANRVKDNFLAVVSHELRTPLTAILIWARLLKRKDPNPDAHDKAVDSIEQSAQAQIALVDDLLDVSRIVAGKLRMDLRPARLRDVVDAALATARPAAELRGVRLVEEFDRAPCVCRVDTDRMRQVVVNLLGNAVKFTPAGGQVRISLRQVDGRAHLRVTDTGQGIAPDFLPYVFDRFRQADSADTRASGGLGLGLSIVKQLVELHDGAIHAQSPGLGQGATFTVELPTVRAAPSKATASKARKNGRQVNGRLPLRGVRVLLVDDDAELRVALQLFLEGAGARVDAAASALAGRERLGGPDRPHVVVSDIAMPQENGYQFAASVRALEGKAARRGRRRLPLIALTASATPDDRRKALEAGFQAHVAKPFEPNHLIDVIRRLATLKGKTKS